MNSQFGVLGFYALTLIVKPLKQSFPNLGPQILFCQGVEIDHL